MKREPASDQENQKKIQSFLYWVENESAMQFRFECWKFSWLDKILAFLGGDFSRHLPCACTISRLHPSLEDGAMGIVFRVCDKHARKFGILAGSYYRGQKNGEMFSKKKPAKEAPFEIGERVTWEDAEILDGYPRMIIGLAKEEYGNGPFAIVRSEIKGPNQFVTLGSLDGRLLPGMMIHQRFLRRCGAVH